MELKRHGVLDTPPSRGMTAFGGAAPRLAHQQP
jgi:hypothetical protein